MLRYVHHLDPMLSLDNAMQVYRAADKYQIDGLLESCGAFIEKHVDPSNVMQVLGLFDVACRLGLERYSKSFLEILGELSRVQTRQERAGMSLATLLSFDGLCIDEERLWRALRSWAELRACGRPGQYLLLSVPQHLPSRKYKEQPEPVLEGLHFIAQGTGSSGGRKSASVAPSELAQSPVPSWQDAIRPLRHLIRFPALSAAFFAKEISKSGVLSHQEVVDIFCFLARKQARKLEQCVPNGPFACTETDTDAHHHNHVRMHEDVRSPAEQQVSCLQVHQDSSAALRRFAGTRYHS
ncbi:unnamed protein product [Effrenium voratum]|uniref:BACK domain-containing protein n=1 Tax=Effrenium voratum TaxID=2562239 RepID=A0AA36MNK2_9DINO|nr:unnamed protein product [Effrenium voratum]